MQVYKVFVIYKITDFYINSNLLHNQNFLTKEKQAQQQEHHTYQLNNNKN